jgi:hypothetical protein
VRRPHKKWTRALVALTICTAIAAGIALWRQSPKPLYEGRDFFSWADQAMCKNDSGEARIALVYFATNHCSWILRGMTREHENEHLDSRIGRLVPDFLRGFPPFSFFSPWRKNHFQVYGRLAFQLAGLQANPALKAVLSDHRHPDRLQAIDMFFAVNVGYPDITERVISPFLLDPDPAVRDAATNAFRRPP